jgi:hypothetical protein
MHEAKVASDMSDRDYTLDKSFIEEEVDRLLGWEILRRYCLCQECEEMKPLELCDKIGVNKGYIHKLIRNIRLRLNGEY